VSNRFLGVFQPPGAIVYTPTGRFILNPGTTERYRGIPPSPKFLSWFFNVMVCGSELEKKEKPVPTMPLILAIGRMTIG
jgi:hypothetical protein